MSRRRKAQHLRQRRPQRGAEVNVPRKLFHGGVPGLQPGDRILSPNISGAQPHHAGNSLHRSDRVYLTSIREAAAMFALEYDAAEYGSVYEVEADGQVQRDPEAPAHLRSYTALSATVIENLGPLCICGSDAPVTECCKHRPARHRIQYLASACPTLGVLPFFDAVACKATPQSLRSEVHGPQHWQQVASNGLFLAYPSDSDLRVVLAFALLHDAFRESDLNDPEHGHRAADWATQNADKLEGIVPLEELIYALQHHADGHVTENPTIGACWDADRIDLVRVGIVPDGDLMSTDLGRQIAGKLGEPLLAATVA